MTRRLEGVLVLPDGLARGVIEFDTLITAVTRSPGAAPAGPPAESGAGSAGRLGAAVPPEVARGELPLVLPGFIDSHVHGGGGGDTMDGADGVRALARFHLGHGTTTLYPATITNPWERVLAALDGVAEAMREGDEELPSIPGAHLEGPFISPDRLGAQPPHTVAPALRLVDEAVGTGAVRLVTMAPEVEGAAAAAAAFARAGVRVSVGHTVAGFERVGAFARAVREAGGVLGFTHLYNAMPGLGSREPGVVGAALADPDAYAELILDLHHVHPASFRVAAAAKQRLHLITDAIRACGMPEGETELGGQRVVVRGGAARLPNGSLAGSVLTLDVALRNAVGAGLSIARASFMTAAVPAAYLGLGDRGVLAPGLRADLIVVDGDLRVREVIVGGRRRAVVA